MPSELWYVRDRNRVTGPFSLEQLDALRRRGQLARFHQVSQDRQTWLSATTLTGLFTPTGHAVAMELLPLEEPAPQAATWYYSTGKDPSGPVTVEDMRGLIANGVIHPGTLVWRDGLPNWITLRDSELGFGSQVAGAAPVSGGVSANGRGKNKVAAALLAFFLGGIGAHKFYLGAWGWGLVYLLFCVLLVPALIGFVEFIILLIMSEEKFDLKYNRGHVSAFTW